jgi:AP-3 complex subunit beta
MLSALIRGVAPGMSEDGEEADMAGVVLRREQVQLVLFEGKLAAKPDDASKGRRPSFSYTRPSWDQTAASVPEDSRALLGSLSVVTGREMLGDRILPDWLEQGTESSLRDSPDDAPRLAVPTALGSATPRAISARASPVVLTPAGGSPVPSTARGAWTDLDRFYDDASEEEESEDEDEEDEEDEAEGSAASNESEPEDSDDEVDGTAEHLDGRHR